MIPAFALSTDQGISRQPHIVEKHFVEVLTTGKVANWSDGDAGQAQVDDELRHALMAGRLLFAGTHQGNHVLRMVGVSGPDLLAIE
ncbi:hypothetical protein D3C78_1684550 [compost metagenome]